ncbi:9532_t:CDS:2, partial [Ambispora leptoticha]
MAESRQTTLPPHAPPTESTRTGLYHPTLTEIQQDSISKLAEEHWAHKDPESRKWDASVVEKIYYKELQETGFATKKLMLLEFSQYLEKYLWTNFDASKASLAHVLLIVLMVNEKFRERVSAWDSFMNMPAQFPEFFSRVLHLSVSPLVDNLTLQVRRFILIFLIHAFQSLENNLVRKECLRLVPISIWHCLSTPERREAEFRMNKELKDTWARVIKKYRAAEGAHKQKLEFERSWLAELLKGFVSILYSIPETGPTNDDAVAYCERFLEFLIDLEAQLPTRRFFNTLLDDLQIVVLCRLAPIVRRKEGSELFLQLLETLKFYAGFEINDFDGSALADDEMTAIHCKKLTELQ